MAADLAARYATRGENFANAREVRNLFENSIARHANRVAKLSEITDDLLTVLERDDLKDPIKGAVAADPRAATQPPTEPGPAPSEAPPTTPAAEGKAAPPTSEGTASAVEPDAGGTPPARETGSAKAT
jgi:hypothetical protein